MCEEKEWKIGTVNWVPGRVTSTRTLNLLTYLLTHSLTHSILVYASKNSVKWERESFCQNQNSETRLCFFSLCEMLT